MFFLSLQGLWFFTGISELAHWWKWLNVSPCQPCYISPLSLVFFLFVSPSYLGSKSSASCELREKTAIRLSSSSEYLGKAQRQIGQSWRNKCKGLVPSSSAGTSHQNSKASLFWYNNFRILSMRPANATYPVFSKDTKIWLKYLKYLARNLASLPVLILYMKISGVVWRMCNAHFSSQCTSPRKAAGNFVKADMVAMLP